VKFYRNLISKLDLWTGMIIEEEIEDIEEK